MLTILCVTAGFSTPALQRGAGASRVAIALWVGEKLQGGVIRELLL